MPSGLKHPVEPSPEKEANTNQDLSSTNGYAQHPSRKLRNLEDPSLKEDERRATLKLDFSVMPLIITFYFFSSLDRSNIGNARVAGLQHDLGLSDHEFSVALTVTFITYVMIKVPATLALKKVGARVLLPMMSFVWGLVTLCEGFVNNFGGLVVARLCLGLTEGGLYPAILLYLSQNYSRDQLQLRIALFYSSASLSGSFSGLLAYAILNLHETWGKPGWAWLFFIEGAMTMVFALSVVWIFPGSIQTNKCLSPKDKQVLIDRLARKSPSTVEEDKFKWSEVAAAIRSPQVFILAATQFLSGLATYSVAYFTPTIVHSLGYSRHRTQLMTSPPFAVAFVFMVTTGYFSDRYQARALTAGLGAVLGFAGFLLFLLVDPIHTHVKYASLFLAIPGTYSITPPIGAWASNNSRGHYRKATAIAFSYSTSTIGGIASTWMFPHSQGPRYRPGIIANLCCCAGILLGITLNFLYLRYAARYKRIHREEILTPYGVDPAKLDSPENERAWRELGDRHPDFKYVY